jgi:diguanylate cyclase (GGDEF)-like protein
VELWNQRTLKSFLVPGGILLLLAAGLLDGGFLPVSSSAVDFYYYAVFTAGILLAWRFHSSRMLFALILLLSAHRALEFFSPAHAISVGPGRIAFEAIAFLLPLNFIILALMRERGIAIPSIVPQAGLLFFESVFIAVICRPEEITGPAFLHAAMISRHLFHWTRVPQLSLFVFAISFAVLLIRFRLYHKPVESGLLWSLATILVALHAGGVGRIANAYWATAGLILVCSIVENSYSLAYHDELTGLPARRAFDDALLGLEEPYAIAAVDIDHFKSFNDTYGHETGDQVLRMVAARLARVTGGGEAFRVGGEEFSILFPGRSIREVASHLELLRGEIEQSKFCFRGASERRSVARGSERRAATRSKGHGARRRMQSRSGELSVTVSIGVAESSSRMREAEQVIQAADKALYRAKQSGRNRVEAATAPRARIPRIKRSIA